MVRPMRRVKWWKNFRSHSYTNRNAVHPPHVIVACMPRAVKLLRTLMPTRCPHGAGYERLSLHSLILKSSWSRAESWAIAQRPSPNVFIRGTFLIVSKNMRVIRVSRSRLPAIWRCDVLLPWRLVDGMKKAGYGRAIDVAANRAGAHPGTHEIGFDSSADTIVLRHTARSREAFARGALKAAQWIVGKKGFYEFSEILFQ